ncbi:hypothetical protein SLEP1_g20191 [Rubroshorea leprosula]|uniref:Trichome birefringence-like N-terminal domain-containing protein n=1 Tax=Rubroshorea leprosula TaxID=152421 RepID=A0AAV5J7R1_9ROSI|nr:hypothetical protein SLEP1_g20191 [Rubroshorea leprosula]
MKSSSSEKCLNMGMVSPFFLSSLFLTFIFFLFILYSPDPLKVMSKHNLDQKNLVLVKPPHGDEVEKDCDLFHGRWVPDLGGSQYTNWSCRTIPESKNCFMHGRQDRDFLNWRWKPDKCDLPRFDPKTFLEFVRGKKLAFVGDSVARNHMESLLCLLSNVETPRDQYKDSDDRKRIWYFPNHDFTLMILWTKFLVSGEERVINGTSSGIFDLHLDKVDEEWTRDIPSVDYIIISDAHWFFRPIYLHDGGEVVGCVYCNEPNVTDHGVAFALRLALRSALRYINRCKKCRARVTLIRTFSPAHFEQGAWNTGGRCNRTTPFGEEEINLGGNEWEMRSMQVEEVEKARKGGQKRGNMFGILDVTKAMLMRSDGHPGEFWGNKWMKGYNDCVHWCLPGPIDIWNDFLMAVLRREAALIPR